ncbi:Uncharacterised protein [Mycobacterium tuberculosis]|nr:Uncharacterised protein [Mycobacterium tuberculosis]
MGTGLRGCAVRDATAFPYPVGVLNVQNFVEHLVELCQFPVLNCLRPGVGYVPIGLAPGTWLSHPWFIVWLHEGMLFGERKWILHLSLQLLEFPKKYSASLLDIFRAHGNECMSFPLRCVLRDIRCL